MNRKPAPRLARELRINNILAAARDVFCEKGYENTAVSEIAARLGVVEGTIYKYFESKRELLLKVLESWYEEMFADYARDLAGVNDTRQRLRLLIWRHLRSIRKYPLLCRLMFREVRSGQDYHGSNLHAMNRRYTQFLVDAIQDGVKNNEFRGDIPPSLLRDMVYGCIEHHTWNFICGRGDLDVDKTADQIAAILCDGLAARRASQDLQRETRRLAKIADRIEKALPRQARN